MPPLSAYDLVPAFLNGEATVDAIAARLHYLTGYRTTWAPKLAGRFLAAFPERRPTGAEIATWLGRDRGFRTVERRLSLVHHVLPDPPLMRPVAAAREWTIPPLEGPADLAAWLALDLEELEWFADRHGLERRPTSSEALRHYRYRAEPKRHGGLRLIESPKPRLKRIQRRILHEILDHIPAHPAVHGFVRGRSIVTFAEGHAGRAAVLELDLRDFFPSIPRARIEGLFRVMGYPEAVACYLAALTTNRAPVPDPLYRWPHLPQGAPTSPMLANLCAWRLDVRLTGLARAASAHYSRYADNLAFSGDAPFATDSFVARASAIAAEEGFTVNHRKTRLMRQSVRQRLTGLVVNQRPTMARAELERLEAILTNCRRHGAASQNRENHPEWRAHLEGRVGFCESVHPAKGARLRALFERIEF